MMHADFPLSPGIRTPRLFTVRILAMLAGVAIARAKADEFDVQVRAAEDLVARARAVAATARARANSYAASADGLSLSQAAEPKAPVATAPGDSAHYEVHETPAAYEARMPGLVDASPFLPLGASDASSATSSAYELRGIMSAADGSRYYIYDPATKVGAWVRLREAGFPFVVNSADDFNDKVTVEVTGAGQQVLVLRSPKIEPFVGSASSAGSIVQADGSQPASYPRLDQAAIKRNLERRRYLRALAEGAGSESPAQP
jgi:hypothetical protein